MAAGASNPSVGSSGSGIYQGNKGPLNVTTVFKEGQRKLLTARLPIRHSKSKRSVTRETDTTTQHLHADDIFLKRDYLQNYNSVLIDLNNTKINEHRQTLCHNVSHCCDFHLKWTHLSAASNRQYYQYRLGALANLRNEVSVEKNTVLNCAVFACIGSEISECGKIFSADVVDRLKPQIAFNEITIQANYPNAEEFLIMPNSLREDLLPVPVGNFEWTVAKHKE